MRELTPQLQAARTEEHATLPPILWKNLKTEGNNSSVYLNKRADLIRIAATDLTEQRPLQERFGDANSAFG